MTNIRYIASLFLAGATFGSAAQSLFTEITVDRTVVTDLPEAAPLPSVFPSVLKDSTNPFSVKPVSYTRWTEFTPVASLFNTPLYTGLTAPSGRRGYVLGGYFPSYNATLAAGYRIVDKADTQIGAAVRFDGYSYKPEDATVKDNTLRLQADASHSFSSGIKLFANVAYMRAALENTASQTLNGFSASAGIAHGNTLSASIKFESFGGHDPVKLIMMYGAERPAKDKRLTAQAAFGVDIDRNSAVDFGISADILKYSGTFFNGEHITYQKFSPVLFDLKPGLRFIGDNFKARLGAYINIGTKTGENTFFIAPDISLAWLPSGMFDAYATFGGSRSFRGLRWQYEVSPFAVYALPSSITRSPVDARAGINIRPASGLRSGFFAGYSSWRNLPVLSLSYAFPGINTGTYPTGYFQNISLSGWNCGFEASYDVAELGRIHADATFYRKGDPTLGDRAKAVLNIGVSATPADKLTVDVDFCLRSGRRYILNSGRYTGSPFIDGFEIINRLNENLRNISNLSIGGNYAVTPQLSVFGRLENILGRRYQIIPKLQSRAFNGLIGATYLF